MWTFVALYAYSATRKEEKSTLMRIAVFKQGAFLPVSTLKEKIDLDANFNHFSLDFFSGRVIGEISTSKRTYRLEALVPHVPFPGYAGLVKFYGAGIIVMYLSVTLRKINR